MIVTRVSNLLSSPKESDDFYFDRSGRFVYIIRYADRQNPTFLVYDIMFNSSIEFTADASVSTVDLIENAIWGFLPVNTEQVLLLLEIRETQRSAPARLILLIGFNVQEKSYGVLDQVSFPNCDQAELVYGDDVCGVFFKNNMDSEIPSSVDNDRSKYALSTFKVQENKIRFDAATKVFNFKPPHWQAKPCDLYLRRDKLWFVRCNDTAIPSARRRSPGSSPPRETSDIYDLISYFDLNEDHPAEVRVSDFNLDEIDHLRKPNLEWVQDCFLVQITPNIFNIFDLSACAWSPDEINCGVNFCSTNDEAVEQMRQEWIVFSWQATVSTHRRSPISIDNGFVLTAVNRKSGHLHRIPLRQPPKLIDLAWVCALNAGLFESNPLLSKKLPYLRVF